MNQKNGKRALAAAVEAVESRVLFAVINVAPNQDLNQVILTAQAGDTLQLQAGTYTPGVVLGNANRRGVFVDKPLTILGAGPAQTIIDVPKTAIDGAALFVFANDVTVSNLTLNGEGDGIDVFKFSEPNTILQNITITNVKINPLTSLNYGSGVFIQNANNVVIEDSTISRAHTNSITLATGVTNTLIKGNTLLGSDGAYSISLGTGSSKSKVVGNTITGSPNGIAVTGQYNEIVANSISGFTNDGITLDTDTNGLHSNFNIIALNLVDSRGRTDSFSSGTGIFLNSESNYNVIFNNRFTGSFENGVAFFRVSNNLLWGNEVSGNGQGGIFLNDNDDTVLVSNGNNPSNNLVIENYSHDNISNNNVQGVRSENNDIERNYLSNTAGTSNAGKGGIRWEGGTGNSSNYNIIENQATGIFLQSNVSTGSTTVPAGTTFPQDMLFFRNRLIDASTNYATGTVAFDAGTAIGGNYYSNDTDASNPYTMFIYTDGEIYDGYADAHPFGTETLGLATNDVTILEPTATTLASAGTRRTIRYYAPAATRVKIELVSPTKGTTVLENNAPNTGLYRWDVANNAATGDDYTIVITPKNSAGQDLSAAVASGTFSISNAGQTVQIASPVRGEKTTASQTVRVSWIYTSANPITVQYQDGDGPWQTLATGVTADYADVTLPSTASSQARFRVIDPLTGGGDTMDGFFLVQGTGAITQAPTGSPAVGSQPLMRWTSPAGSVQVDVQLINGDTTTTLISGLPDVGEYRLSIPDVSATGAKLRVTYKNASGATIGTAESGTFDIAGANAAITFYDAKQNPVLNNGTVPPPPPPPTGTGIDLTGSLTGNLPGGVVAGKKAKAKITVTNSGTVAASGTVTTSLYLVKAGSTVDATTPFATLPAKKANLKAGKSVSIPVSFTYPSDLTDGSYTLVARFSTSGITEDNTANNTLSLSTPVTVEAARVDVAVTAISPPVSVAPGKVKYSITVVNNGNVKATSKTGTVELFGSSDTTLGPVPPDVLLGTNALKLGLKPGQTKVIKVTANVASGLVASGSNLFLAARVTPATTIADTNSVNDVIFSSSTVLFE